MVDTQYSGVVSYGILRREFDNFLLQRASVRVMAETPVTKVQHTGATWILNAAVETPMLIGAGGHFCPVARYLRGGGADLERPIVAKEAEFRSARFAPTTAQKAPSLYFCRDLDGYGWCVPKGDYVNVGIGRREHRDFARHVADFVTFLEAHDIHAGDADVRWHGHAYFAAGTSKRPLIDRGVVLIGDAAGLAYPESGEGIRPSIESALLAAQTLIAARDGSYDLDVLQPYADAIRAAHPEATAHSTVGRMCAAAIGRILMRSRMFNRHVVLDQWFLRHETGA
jgi:flavin-dependent dehydrogenase